MQYQVDRVEVNSGTHSQHLLELRDHLVSFGAQLESVRDTGTAAVRILHDEIHASRPAAEDLDVRDGSLRDEFRDLRAHLEAAAARLRSDATETSIAIYGKLQHTELTVAQRLDASDVLVRPLFDRISVIEQKVPIIEASLAELRVGRAQTGQLASHPSVVDFASLADKLQRVEMAADHTQSELSQVLRDRDAEKGTCDGLPHTFGKKVGATQ